MYIHCLSTSIWMASFCCLLFIVLWYLCFGEDYKDCTGYLSCEGDIYCDSNDDCRFYCIGVEACQSLIAHCPDNYECYLQCIGQRSCQNMTVHGGEGGNILIWCEDVNTCVDGIVYGSNADELTFQECEEGTIYIVHKI